MTKKITLMDIKNALLDKRFREKLPDELSGDVQKFLQNPGCACNHPIYRKILQKVPTQLAEYYPGKETADIEEEIKKTSQNDWQVINCNINELQAKLRELPPGRKQLDLARWQDQVTVIVNHMDIF